MRVQRIGDGVIPGTGTFCEYFDFVPVSEQMLSQMATLPTIMTMWMHEMREVNRIVQYYTDCLVLAIVMHIPLRSIVC